MYHVGAVVGGDWRRLSLRRLLWCYGGVSYHAELQAGRLTAGLWNSKRSKVTERVWSWQDFHSRHIAAAAAVRRRPKSVLFSLALGFGCEFDELPEGV